MNTQQQAPWLTHEQERSLLARARAGEDVRNEVILALQRHISRLASSYLEHGRRNPSVDYMDLVQSANLALFQKYEEAMTKENPFGYLIQVARFTIVYCLSYRNDLIKTHEKADAVSVLSLDHPSEDGFTLADIIPDTSSCAPSPTEAQRAAVSQLLQAIEELPSKQRIVIKRHYGIDGHAPETLKKISQQLPHRSAQTQHAGNATYHHRLALATLRQRLENLLPQYTEMGGAR